MEGPFPFAFSRERFYCKEEKIIFCFRAFLRIQKWKIEGEGVIMKITLRDIALVVFFAFLIMIWEMIPILLFAGYLMLSIIIGGGHPWPYHALFLFGLIPCVIFGIYGTATYFLFRRAAIFRKLFLDWRFYAGGGLLHGFWIAAVLFAFRSVWVRKSGKNADFRNRTSERRDISADSDSPKTGTIPGRSFLPQISFKSFLRRNSWMEIPFWKISFS